MEPNGIGPAVVKQHVEAHEGRTWVVSTPPARRTTIIFT